MSALCRRTLLSCSRKLSLSSPLQTSNALLDPIMEDKKLREARHCDHVFVTECHLFRGAREAMRPRQVPQNRPSRLTVIESKPTTCIATGRANKRCAPTIRNATPNSIETAPSRSSQPVRETKRDTAPPAKSSTTAAMAPNTRHSWRRGPASLQRRDSPAPYHTD